MKEAVCIQCGAWKRHPARACRRCGLDPRRDGETLVKSVYLSTGRFDAPEDRAAYREELKRASSELAAGTPVQFDERELERLRHERAAVNQVPLRAVYGALGRLFLPAVLFLAVLYGLIFLLRALVR